MLENWLRIHLSYFLCSQPRLNKVKNLAILEVEIRGNWAMKRAISSNFLDIYIYVNYIPYDPRKLSLEVELK